MDRTERVDRRRTGHRHPVSLPRSTARTTRQVAVSTAELLQQFLQQLKKSLADSTYSATKAGDTTDANDPSLSGVLINDRI